MAGNSNDPGRVTAPKPKGAKHSALWVPTSIFTLLIVGFLVILLNYTGLFPGGQQNQYLFLGLGLIMGGLVVATQYR